MAFSSLLLIVGASFIHATWNLLAKRAAAVGPVFVFAYNLVSVIGYAPWVLYQLSRGSIGWTATGVGFVLLSGLLHLCYSLCLQRGYPVARGTGPMLSKIGVLLIVGEMPTARGLLGLIAGVIALAGA